MSRSRETDFPSLQDLAELAKDGKRAELVLGLCKRQDALNGLRYVSAVKSFEYLTDRPKATVTEARIVGDMAGVAPETPESLIQALMEVCDRQR